MVRQQTIINKDPTREFLVKELSKRMSASSKPWLRVQDVSSQGVVAQEKNWKSSRAHSLLSALERKFLFELEWSSS